MPDFVSADLLLCSILSIVNGKGKNYAKKVHIHNRIRIPYNCVELIFGMVHPSTFERLKTQLVFFNSWSNVSTLGVFLSD